MANLSQLQRQLDINNVYALPRIEKVVLNVGLGRLLSGVPKPADILEDLRNEFALICGQRPIITRAKKSIASFKVRQGQPLGLKVTLRGQRMRDFTDRLIKVALPRSRDFKGIDLASVDKSGNLTIGIREHTIFPEVAESVRGVGFEVTIVTNASSREEAITLYRALGFPLKK